MVLLKVFHNAFVVELRSVGFNIKSEQPIKVFYECVKVESTLQI